MKNALSIDVEDWFCAANMRAFCPQEDWSKLESRVVQNTTRILDLLDSKKVKATFFVLGWIAEHHPDVVKEISLRGHEIASHGYSHTLLTGKTPVEFEQDLGKAISATKKCTTQNMVGFRAPSFTVTPKTMWAIDILAKHGFRYDSSVFPIGFHPDYGIADGPLGIYEIRKSFFEFPMTVSEVMGQRVPCSGGAYFRLLPYFVTRILLRRVKAEGRPFVFYVHPWEIDEGQPRMPLSFSKRIRHYTNLDKTYSRLVRLIGEFEFNSIRSVLGL